MSVEATRETVTGYWQALAERGDFGRFLTEDATFSIPGTDQAANGRGAVVETIRWFHEQAFDATPELKGLVAGDEQAAVEADFVGTHTGDFAGVGPTGKSVRLPYVIVYDLAGDKIKAVRVYMSLDALVRQFGEQSG